MAKRQVVVKAINNRSSETVRFPGTSGGFLEIGPGVTVGGPLAVVYDDEEVGAITPSPNEIWFIGSVEEFRWATVTIPGRIG